MKMVLVVEDNPTTRSSMQLQLESDGYQVMAVASAEQASELLESQSTDTPDLVLLDIRLPGMSGIEFVRLMVERDLLPPTVVVSGEATVAEALEAVHHGVCDFVEKPVSSDRLRHTVRSVLERTALERQVSRLRRQLHAAQNILGVSPQVEALRDLVAKVAATEATVLVRGNSGTGKELVASALHNLGPRHDGPLVTVNCAALPASLIEAELFGHVRGAFTDARTDRSGLFEEAHRGTLFLDEVGEMEPALQARFLRVLEDGKVRRVGSTLDRTVDVRVIAATHLDLEVAVQEGVFRQDLFYRLAQLVIEVPPLRDRPEDIPVLFRHFLDEACERHRRPQVEVKRATMRVIESHNWPGNVRELKNLCERLAVLGDNPIGIDQLPSSIQKPDASTNGSPATVLTLREVRHRAERIHILQVLKDTKWNVAAAARQLAIHRTHLHQKMAEFGIERPTPE
ncbi:MAG: sigma-54-dependent Fis family transcriptional regulator [bacterium]|nr:sigma-54-dependent Fis family transcriptional regulator [bacterium]